MVSVKTLFKIQAFVNKHWEENLLVMQRTAANQETFKVAKEQDLITQEQLMYRFNISKTTLWRYRKEGMPSMKIGKKIFYDLKKIKKYIGGHSND